MTDYLKISNFIKGLFYNRRVDWHKADFNLLFGCEKILDVGCGRGLFIKFAPHRIIGIDRNWNSLTECLKKGYMVIKGDAKELPFAEQSFDGIHCADIIEHFSPSDARSIIIDMLRVLKTGGLLVIGTPFPSLMFWDDPSHVRPYPPKSLLSYCVKDSDKGIGSQATFESFPYRIKFIKLKLRYTQIYQMPLGLYFDKDRMKLKNLLRLSTLLFMFSNLLSRFGLNDPRPEGYIIVMQKT
jgi:ubiquinone/menaquinone biosynthesis C-methylase UbiE